MVWSDVSSSEGDDLAACYDALPGLDGRIRLDVRSWHLTDIDPEAEDVCSWV
jgi:hypothetical protein